MRRVADPVEHRDVTDTEDAGDAVPDDGAERAADEAGHTGLEEEDAANVAVACADGFQDADLASTLSDRGEQRVGDAEGGDGEGDDPDSREHELDDPQVPTNEIGRDHV